MLAIAIALFIAGCANTHGIAPLSHPVAANSLDVGAAVKAAAREAGWPDNRWWRALHDPQLDHLIDAALVNSPTMAVAAARVRLANAMAMGESAALAPQLNFDTSIGRKRFPDNYFYGPGILAHGLVWNNLYTLGLSYDLDLWGKQRDLAQRSLDTAHATAAEARAAQLDLEANIVRAYVGFSMNYALRDNLAGILTEQQRMLDFSNARLQGGIGTQFEVSQAQAPLPETQRQIEVIDESLKLQRNQLAALIGQGPGGGDHLQRPALASAALASAVPLSLPSTLPLELVGHRPDIVAQRWRIEAQTKGIAAAKAAFYPNINLALMANGFGVAGGPLAGGFLSFLAGKSLSYSAGPALSLPIFDGGRLRAELGAASAEYDIEVERYNQMVITALKQIADQLVVLQALDQQQKQVELSLTVARKNNTLAFESYRRGLTDSLNTLQAQAQLLGGEQNQQRITARRLSAYAALMAALGGGVLTTGEMTLDPQPGATAVARSVP